MSVRTGMVTFCLGAIALTLAGSSPWSARPIRAAAEEPPNRVALLVGVNKYNNRHLAESPLRFARRDVQELAVVLREQGFTVQTLTGPQATKANINSALTALLKGRTARDVVVIGFAGHGGQSSLVDNQGKAVQDNQGNELSEAYFSPVNAVFGEMSSVVGLTRLLEQLDSKGGINLLMVDACRDDPDPHRGLARGGAKRSFAGNTHFGRMPGNSAILFSCSKGQQALEHEKAGGGHGVFFHHVIEGLRGAAADPETGEVGWDELVAHVRKRVNPTARELDPEGARKADELFDGQLQTPHQLTNLIATPVLARRPRLLEGTQAGQERDDNALKLKLCWCSAGTFVMGSPNGEPDRKDDEGPVEVQLKRGFWMGKHEVTQAQWRTVMGTTLQAQKDKAEGANELHGEGPDHPIYYVSHVEAAEFCRRLTASERRAGRLPAGWAYRLPTEAEWEYACRAGTKTATAFGDRLSSTDANFDGNSPYNGAENGPDEKAAIAVGGYRPNDWGILDMHGNVSEWCADYFDKVLPGGTDPHGPTNPPEGTPQVIRGGNWDCPGSFCRSAARDSFTSEYPSRSLGFRVARAPEGPGGNP